MVDMAPTSVRPIGFDSAPESHVDAHPQAVRRWSPIEQRDWYDAAWRRMNRRGLAVVAVLVAVPVTIAATVANVTGAPLAWLTVGLAGVVFGNLYALAPCPRCEKPFGHRRGTLFAPRQPRCLHCGLGRGHRPSDPTRDERDD